MLSGQNKKSQSGKTLILLATSGTVHDEAAVVYQSINTLFREFFSETPIAWSYTSRRVRETRGERGECYPSPGEALREAVAEGFEKIIVISLHLAPGIEYTELEHEVESIHKECGTSIFLSAALLNDLRSLQVILAELLSSLPQPFGGDEGLLLVAHGSPTQRGQAAYLNAALVAQDIDPRLVFAAGGATGSLLAETLRVCRCENFKTVKLMPFTITAGSTMREITDSQAGSWRLALEEAGIGCAILAPTLASLSTMRNFWLRQAAAALYN